MRGREIPPIGNFPKSPWAEQPDASKRDEIFGPLASERMKRNLNYKVLKDPDL